jgi:hypothetical protein
MFIISAIGSGLMRRWTVIFSTGTFCLWKAHLSHSFDKPNAYWNPEAISAIFLSMLRKRIIADRSLSLSKIYKDNENNPLVFEEVWGENPREIKVLKGPKCIRAMTGENIASGTNDLSVLMNESETGILLDSDSKLD